MGSDLRFTPLWGVGRAVSLVDRIIGARKTWLTPLIITVVIFAVLFFLVGGTIDIPFLYRSAK
jgi:Family of unknown function (DUF5989)